MLKAMQTEDRFVRIAAIMLLILIAYLILNSCATEKNRVFVSAFREYHKQLNQETFSDFFELLLKNDNRNRIGSELLLAYDFEKRGYSHLIIMYSYDQELFQKKKDSIIGNCSLDITGQLIENNMWHMNDEIIALMNNSADTVWLRNPTKYLAEIDRNFNFNDYYSIILKQDFGRAFSEYGQECANLEKEVFYYSYGAYISKSNTDIIYWLLIRDPM